MSQHDYDIANAAGLAFRQDLNLALASILTNNSGATEPSSTAAYMIWADTTAGLIKMRNAADTGWVNLGAIDGFIASQTAVDAGTVDNKFVTPYTLANTEVPNATTATKHGVLNVMVLDIGDWNMNSNADVLVSHGFGSDLSKFRSLTVLIRNDDETNIRPLNYRDTEGRFEIHQNNVKLYRVVDGLFDGSTYDSTSYNRGYIIIWYID